MASPVIVEQIARLTEDPFELFEKPGSTFPEFNRLLSFFPSLSERYNRDITLIGQSFMGGYTEPAIASAKSSRYQVYKQYLQQLKQIQPKINISQPVRMSGPGYGVNTGDGLLRYSHNMTPAGMRETAAREAAARNAAARNAAARNAAARNAAARNAAARNVAAREAAARNAAARNAREAEAAANKNKVKAPLNFWLRANGVRVMSAHVEDNKSYVLLVTNFATNSDDVFKVTKIGDRLYKVGKYTTDKNNKIVYNSMDEEQVEGEGVLELYKVPDSLQSGSGRKSRRNRRKSQKSRKSRKHH